MPKFFPAPKIALPLNMNRETHHFLTGIESYIEIEQSETGDSDSEDQDFTNLHKRKQRHHFLTKVFTLAAFREGKEFKDKKGLQTFHRSHKYLFMAYHPAISKEMGRVTASPQSSEKQRGEYEGLLHQLLKTPPERSGHINACQHMFGYLKKDLNKEEKEGFQEKLELYKRGEACLTEILEDIYRWAEEFQKEYLLEQTYFEPYTAELLKKADSAI